jgi:hypothetical protein
MNIQGSVLDRRMRLGQRHSFVPGKFLAEKANTEQEEVYQSQGERDWLQRQCHYISDRRLEQQDQKEELQKLHKPQKKQREE